MEERYNRAIIIPSNVNYIAFYGSVLAGFDYKSANQGALQLVAAILEDRYLRKELRERGGAYGFHVSVYTSGRLLISSYRDPHLKRTFQIIRKCGEYIRELEMSKEELWDFKNRQLSGMLDDEDHDPWGDQEEIRSIELKGMEADFDRKVAEQICNCTIEEIHQAADVVEQMLSHGRFCVFGSKASIIKRKDLFGTVEEIMNDEEEAEVEQSEDVEGQKK